MIVKVDKRLWGVCGRGKLRQAVGSFIDAADGRSYAHVKRRPGLMQGRLETSSVWVTGSLPAVLRQEVPAARW